MGVLRKPVVLIFSLCMYIVGATCTPASTQMIVPLGFVLKIKNLINNTVPKHTCTDVQIVDSNHRLGKTPYIVDANYQLHLCLDSFVKNTPAALNVAWQPNTLRCTEIKGLSLLA